MSTRTFATAAVLGMAIALPLAAADAAAPARAQQSQETIYGSQLMTPQERTEYRAKMRSATTQAERDRIRDEHHAAMQERAKARGVTLPGEPPAAGGRSGIRRGPGNGPGVRRGPPAAPGSGY